MASPRNRGYMIKALRDLFEHDLNVTFPLPCTRGRGAGVRGLESLAKTLRFCADPAPSPPTPLPRVQGRGETQGIIRHTSYSIHPWQQPALAADFFADGGTSLAGFSVKKPLGLSMKPMY